MKNPFMSFAAVAALLLSSPYFVAAQSCSVGTIGDDTAATGTTTATSLTGYMPSGTKYPVFLVSVLALQGTGATSVTIAQPSGWTLQGTYPCNDGGHEINFAVATRIAKKTDAPGDSLVWAWGTTHLYGSEAAIAFGGVVSVDVLGTGTCADLASGEIVGSAISPFGTPNSTDITLGVFVANGNNTLTLNGSDLAEISTQYNSATGPALLVASSSGAAEVDGPENVTADANSTTVGALIGLGVTP